MCVYKEDHLSWSAARGGETGPQASAQHVDGVGDGALGLRTVYRSAHVRGAAATAQTQPRP